MARVKPGDPHQLWFQDFWNQFGCSTRQGAVGVLGETCHIKSQAFVLINKATRQLVWAGEEGQPLTLAPYSISSKAELTRRCTLFDLASTVPQHSCVLTASLYTASSHSTHSRLRFVAQHWPRNACTSAPHSAAAKYVHARVALHGSQQPVELHATQQSHLAQVWLCRRYQPCQKPQILKQPQV